MAITKPIFHSELAESEVKRRKYAFPEQRRFPLTDRGHVLSAIKFFNYAKPDEEATLAKAIIKRMGELGMDDVNVGDKNRFKNYYKKVEHGDMIKTKPIFSDDSEYLEHYGVKGMKWGKHLMADTNGRDQEELSRLENSAHMLQYNIRKNLNVGRNSSVNNRLVTKISDTFRNAKNRNSNAYSKWAETRLSQLQAKALKGQNMVEHMFFNGKATAKMVEKHNRRLENIAYKARARS